jgi:hypothetical protein
MSEGSMKTITIRGVDPEMDVFVKKCARENGQSINQWILLSLKKIVGLGKKSNFEKHHDLDRFAGGWDRRELEEFNKNTAVFESIDKDLWK